MAPNEKVLVYQYRAETAPVVQDGLAVIKVSELDAILEKNPDLQSTRKPLARGAMSVEVYERDLLTEAQQTQFAGLPNYEANVAGVKIPWKVWLGSLVGTNGFGEIVILSKKR